MPVQPASAARVLRRVRLTVDAIAHGGEGVGRLADGKVCFVPFTAPGDEVVAEVVAERSRWARGRLLEVLSPSAARVPPPCPYYGPDRCGGCRLQHLGPAAQARVKRAAVRDTLERIGGVTDPVVHPTVVPASFSYRLWARFAVRRDGRLGFRRPASHDIIPIDRCLLLATEAQALRNRAGDRWAGAAQVTVRAVGSAAVLSVRSRPGARVDPPPAVAGLIAGPGSAGRAGRAATALHVRVDGLPLRVSAGSFFQPGLAGAEALSRLVRAAADVGPGERALDLYAGVGLFAAGLAADGARVTAVEGNRSAAADARANLPEATVVGSDVGSYLRSAGPADVVVLDPPRAGAGPEVVKRVTALRPRRVVYVACEPAALARDSRAFVADGWRLHEAVPVDQFAQTAAVEVVATFVPPTSTQLPPLPGQAATGGSAP